MVVISASIISKQGKVLLSRQFVDITRSQIEGFLGSFSKLLDSKRQHTFIENESIRFVYQAIDDYYLVLTTTKDSNIVEDLETLRLIHKVVSYYCPFGLDEGNILAKSFEIIMACDDAITMGYRESVTLGQLLTYAEMESAEERLYKEKQKAQMQEVKELAKKKQKELDQKRAIEKKQQTSAMPNFPPIIEQPTLPQVSSNPVEAPVTEMAAPRKTAGKGMKLVSKGRKAALDDM